MKVIDIKIDKLNPYENNINMIEPTKMADLYRSIRDNGLLEPLLVTPNGNGYVVIDGNHRLYACRRAGFNHVSCIVKDIKKKDWFKYCVHINEFRGTKNIDKLIGVITNKINSGETIDEISKELNIRKDWVMVYFDLRHIKVDLPEMVEFSCYPLLIPRKLAIFIDEFIEKLMKSYPRRKLWRNGSTSIADLAEITEVDFRDLGFIFGQWFTENFFGDDEHLVNTLMTFKKIAMNKIMLDKDVIDINEMKFMVNDILTSLNQINSENLNKTLLKAHIVKKIKQFPDKYFKQKLEGCK